MAENKTKATDASVDDFLSRVEPEQRRIDGRRVCEMMARITGEPPVMWGPSIIGFGSTQYRYDSGREGVIARIGFSPRKAQLVFYLAVDVPGRDALLAKLGKYSTSKACLYIRKLADVDMAVLETLIAGSWAYESAI
ncbi:MAG: hypothetical protein JWN66_1406 [Sphingomonas bacterium]|uniref:DUF1801 domain-containing protein n=1 Tax=Sphingomonas bacterium TaxID=1895847 RepID=UPI002602ED4A|nr:DUF1801 domain-containing protein [Sphingomonas bacterium]MDB5704290.1 hypothetical protein [Sphingomonas bacterium]